MGSCLQVLVFLSLALFFGESAAEKPAGGVTLFPTAFPTAAPKPNAQVTLFPITNSKTNSGPTQFSSSLPTSNSKATPTDYSKLTNEQLLALGKELNQKVRDDLSSAKGVSAVVDRAKEQKITLDQTCMRVVAETLKTFYDSSTKTHEQTKGVVDEVKKRTGLNAPPKSGLPKLNI